MEETVPSPTLEDTPSYLIPIVFIIATLFIIALFFYKRAIHEFRINQVDDLEKAFTQQHERIPCVVSDFPTPQGLWSDAVVKNRQVLATSTLEDGSMLQTYITTGGSDMSDDDAAAYAEQTGLTLWSAHNIYPSFKAHTSFGFLYNIRTSAYVGPRGLHKTTAPATLIIPTDADHIVSICTEEAEPYLPIDWHGRQLGELTIEDTPLLGHIDYMDIVARPGNAVILPAHWIYCISGPVADAAADAGPIFYSIVEIHHPVSAFVDRVLGVRGLK
jgi:hypothetical protein